MNAPIVEHPAHPAPPPAVLDGAVRATVTRPWLPNGAELELGLLGEFLVVVLALVPDDPGLAAGLALGAQSLLLAGMLWLRRHLRGPGIVVARDDGLEIVTPPRDGRGEGDSRLLAWRDGPPLVEERRGGGIALRWPREGTVTVAAADDPDGRFAAALRERSAAGPPSPSPRCGPPRPLLVETAVDLGIAACLAAYVASGDLSWLRSVVLAALSLPSARRIPRHVAAWWRWARGDPAEPSSPPAIETQLRP